MQICPGLFKSRASKCRILFAFLHRIQLCALVVQSKFLPKRSLKQVVLFVVCLKHQTAHYYTSADAVLCFSSMQRCDALILCKLLLVDCFQPLLIGGSPELGGLLVGEISSQMMLKLCTQPEIRRVQRN